MGFLPSVEAKTAVLEPARHYGYTYDDETLHEIILHLEREGTVEPFLLQIVCDRLWRKLGETDASAVPGAERVLTLHDLYAKTINGVQGIIDSYFGEILVDLATQAARADAFEIIELLITGEGTRNIVEERVLVEASFRSRQRRKTVLDTLVNAKFLRRERRLGTLFVELTHECLIRSAQTHILEHAVGSRALRAAIRTLDGIEKGDPPVIDADDFHGLDAAADQIEWPSWCVVLMYQAAALHSAKADRIRYWHDRYVECAANEPPPDLTHLLRGDRYFTLPELRAIEIARQAKALPADLPRRQAERIMRSLLVAGTPRDYASIEHWTRRIEES